MWNKGTMMMTANKRLWISLVSTVLISASLVSVAYSNGITVGKNSVQISPFSIVQARALCRAQVDVINADNKTNNSVMNFLNDSDTKHLPYNTAESHLRNTRAIQANSQALQSTREICEPLIGLIAVE